MRKLRNVFLAGLSAFGIGVAMSNTAEAQSTVNVAEAEQACQRALEAGTIEALEEFLFRYPDAPRECRVLALAQLTSFNPEPGGPGGGGDPGGYGG